MEDESLFQFSIIRDGGGSTERGSKDQDQRDARILLLLLTYIPPWPLLLQRCTTRSVSTFLIRSGRSSPPSSQRTISPALDRNNFLADRGIPLPKATSTGTTIVGCLFKDGIILGADTRATEGDIVADKNCEKVSDELPPPLVLNIISLSDSLHHRIHSMLWCRYRRRHRVHDSDDIQ